MSINALCGTEAIFLRTLPGRQSELVKMVADLHGGRADVQSREGEGSRFTVWLPSKNRSLTELVSPAAAAPPEEAQLVDHR